MYTLGINAAFHDSAAVILKDGVLLAAVEDERFTHVKHGKRPIPFLTFELPFHAINYCLEEAGIHINEVDHFAYSFDPYQLLPRQYADKDSIPIPLHSRPADQDSMWSNEWDPLFLSSIINGRLQLQDGYPHHLQKRFVGANIPEAKWHFVDHHISHAASAFHASPFREAAVITIDGRGEKATTLNELHR